MPDFSGNAALLEEVTTSALDFYLNRGKAHHQTIQEKPLARILEGNMKDFTGGRGNISIAVKGVFGNAGTNDSLRGFQLDEQVTFYNPRNTRRVNYDWKEHHIGITFTFTEAKVDGILMGEGTRSAIPDAAGGRKLSGRDQTVIVEMIGEKLADFSEQYARSLVNLGWGDGVADPRALTGIRGYITDTPALGSTGGLARNTNAWWRNRAWVGATGANANGPRLVSATAGGGALLQFFQREVRQLRRFGARPNVMLCGSDFMDALEREFRANGVYSQSGFSGQQNGAMGSLRLAGGLVPEYDPALDDLGRAKFAYIWPTDDLFLMKMPGDWKTIHSPARPADRFVVFRSIVCTGQMVVRRLNGCGVYEIA